MGRDGEGVGKGGREVGMERAIKFHMTAIHASGSDVTLNPECDCHKGVACYDVGTQYLVVHNTDFLECSINS